MNRISNKVQYIWTMTSCSLILLQIDDLYVGASLNEGNAERFGQRGFLQGYYATVDVRSQRQCLTVRGHKSIILLPAYISQHFHYASRHAFIKQLLVNNLHRLICGLLQVKS